MKDLFVFVADSDAQAVMKTVLLRHEALKIRPITFTVDRHPMRDSGMVTDGPELIRLRLRKEEYSRVMLLWDHDGSGKVDASECAAEIRRRLDAASWRHRSEAVVIVPELEEWFLHNPASIAKLMRLRAARVAGMLQERRPGSLLGPHSKELFEDIFYQCLRRKPLPGDFEAIARTASLTQLQASDSFRSVVTTLRSWFPVAS